MTRGMFVATVFGVILTTCSLPAQSTFVMPDGSAPPKTVRTDVGLNGKVWVAFDGYRPKYGVDDRSDDVPGQVLSFMDSFFVVAEHGQATQNGHRLFLAKSRDGKKVLENVGWVDGAVVVMSNTAMHDPKTGVHRKAMIVQTLETLQARDEKNGNFEDKVGVTPVPIPRSRLTPQQREKAIFFELFNVFFVFAETDSHLLIGTGDYFDGLKDATSVVKGWLEKSHAARWNTRLAIEWDRSTTLTTANSRRMTPGLGFTTAEDANDYVRGRMVGETAIVFREELDRDGVSLGFKPSEMRMPILAKGKTNYLPTQNQLIHVGGIYGARVDFQAQEKVRQELSKAAERLNHLQILFVIDDTGSMGKYFPQVAKTIGVVNQSLATLATQGANAAAATKVSIAVSYYADELYSKVPFTVRRLRTLNDSVARELVDELSGYDEMGLLRKDRPKNAHEVQGGKDAPESVFLGIEKALDAAGFDSFGQKLVVVIGDMGDRIVAAPDEQAARQQLLKRLLPLAGDPIQLLAVQVAANEDEAQKEVFTRFRRQMNALAQDYREQLAARIKTDPDQLGNMAHFVDSAQSGQVVSTLLNSRYSQLAQEAKLLQEEFRKIASGERSHTEVGPAERLRLQQSKIDVRVLARRQIFREGYVWLNDRSQKVRAVRQVALIEEQHIAELVNLLDRLVGPRNGFRPTSLQALVSRELDALAGEREKGSWQHKADWLKKDLRKVTLAEAFFDQMGIPANSDLFGMPPEQIGKLPEDRFNELVKRLRLRHYRLKDILGKVKNDWKWEPRTAQSGEAYEELVAHGEPASSDRAYVIPADPRRTRWFWVDVEEELP